jgi:hypothetical protein
MQQLYRLSHILCINSMAVLHYTSQLLFVPPPPPTHTRTVVMR